MLRGSTSSEVGSLLFACLLPPRCRIPVSTASSDSFDVLAVAAGGVSLAAGVSLLVARGRFSVATSTLVAVAASSAALPSREGPDMMICVRNKFQGFSFCSR